MSNVVDLPVISRVDGTVNRNLEKALEAGLESVIIIGNDADGNEYFASSYAGGHDVLWLLERIKMKLLAVPETHFGH